MNCAKCGNSEDHTKIFLRKKCERDHFLCDVCSTGPCSICGSQIMQHLRLEVIETSQTKFFKPADIPWRDIVLPSPKTSATSSSEDETDFHISQVKEVQRKLQESLLAVRDYGCSPQEAEIPVSPISSEAQIVPQRAGEVIDDVMQYFRVLGSGDSVEVNDHSEMDKMLEKCFRTIESKHDAANLRITQAPVQCPVSECQTLFCPADFVNHFRRCHRYIPWTEMEPRESVELEFDPRLVQMDSVKGIAMFLVKNMISGLRSDLLPVLLMVTKFKMSQVFDDPEDDETSDTSLMFWLTSLCAEAVEMFGTVEVYRPEFMMAPEITKSIRCGIYPVREEHSARQLFKAGSLVLSTKDCIDMTRNKLDPLKITVTVHELEK